MYTFFYCSLLEVSFREVVAFTQGKRPDYGADHWHWGCPELQVPSSTKDAKAHGMTHRVLPSSTYSVASAFFF